MKSLRPKRKRVRPLLGTFVSIELEAPVEAELLDRWISAGFEAVEEVDRLMSVHRADSDISRLNRAAPGEWVRIHALTRSVLLTSLQLFRASGGIFDIRAGAAPAGTAPLEIRGRNARKTGYWTVDLGGIAKGFAVDHAVERMSRLTSGFPMSGTVNAGGDLRVWGTETVSNLSRIAIATSAVRTSGDVCLAPAVHRQMPSGRPLQKKQTVTVFAPRCLWADALTKVVLLASRTIARDCLAACRARAVLFGSDGRLQEVMG